MILKGVDRSALAPKRAARGELLNFLLAVPDTSECVLWPYSLNSSGYGSLSYKGRTYGAHQVIFDLKFGYLPPVVRHTCDTPRCINPNHLLPGTVALNNEDTRIRNRTNPYVKLSAEDVAFIKENNIKGSKGNTAALALRFNVTIGYIRGLARGYKCPTYAE